MRFSSASDAIEDTPQQAASTRVRSERGTTQTEAAKLFAVTQPRISDLTRGKIDFFSLYALIDMAAVTGLAPQIKIKMAA